MFRGPSFISFSKQPHNSPKELKNTGMKKDKFLYSQAQIPHPHLPHTFWQFGLLFIAVMTLRRNDLKFVLRHPI